MGAFDALLTDTVEILKRSGETIPGIKAAVTGNGILIQRSDVLMESGDLIRRSMSNGADETFEVIDPGFHERFHGIPAGYQMKVKKLGMPEANAAVRSITVNVSGANARINANSVDNSINSYVSNPDVAEHLTALREEVERLGLEESLEIVGAIEGQFESGNPSKPVVKTLINSLPAAGSIASIGSLIVACLS